MTGKVCCVFLSAGIRMPFTARQSLCLLGMVLISLFPQPARGQENANQVAKTTQSLTTAAQMRETTVMLMKPHANWEEYLTPAPLSIAIMGELVFISSAADFSISSNKSKDDFKYIRYPESFRACLMQICNSGWHAFNEAHVNMDQIRIHTATVPDYMKAAVHTLFKGSDAVIENLLPIQLDNIRVIADDCVALAESVRNKYMVVINLIQELLEACISAKRFYGVELERVKLKLKETKLREQSAQLLKEQSLKSLQDMEKRMDEARAMFKEAMDSMPSGWDSIKMDVVDGLASMFYTTKYSTPNIEQSPTNQNTSGENTVDYPQKEAYSKSAEILILVETLKQFVSGSEINWKDLYDQEKQRPKSKWTEDQFQRIFNAVDKLPKGKGVTNVLAICQKGLNICKELATYSPNCTWDQAKTEQVINNITKLNDDTLTLDSKSKKVLGSPALTPKPPMMYKAQSSGRQRASERATENARFKIEQSREQLKNTRELYEKSVERMQMNQKELTDILVEMQSCNITEIDFETTIKMLVKGLDAMGRVKQQWEKMVRFFQMVSTIVKTSLSKTLHYFVQTSNVTMHFSHYNDRLFNKDLLYKQAFEASNIASLVHMISSTYTEVSNQYLMDRVSSLGRLMAMDKESPEFNDERLNLQESCKAAQEGILQLVVKNKNEFETETDARMEKIEGELMAVLPTAQPQETKRIKEIVQKGFSEEDGDVNLEDLV